MPHLAHLTMPRDRTNPEYLFDSFQTEADIVLWLEMCSTPPYKPISVQHIPSMQGCSLCTPYSLPSLQRGPATPLETDEQNADCCKSWAYNNNPLYFQRGTPEVTDCQCGTFSHIFCTFWRSNTPLSPSPNCSLL